MTANQTRIKNVGNRLIEVQGDVLNMLKIKSKKVPEYRKINKQDQADYVKFNLDILRILL
ncbi:hypothetical protein EZV73_08695 [Acidaminobacter sp. JC074]|uniref:hypothetical protein n=1 Tax=Acidaminobacter sp. JC074 TaxID=2530199 RepID=UPI001F0FBF24|nr:hypothetical protein [Acidaminobacter sp. JC074]MCH4887649.1 hypothetical protein [Acidaminobacter sp. JC074]